MLRCNYCSITNKIHCELAAEMNEHYNIVIDSSSWGEKQLGIIMKLKYYDLINLLPG